MCNVQCAHVHVSGSTAGAPGGLLRVKWCYGGRFREFETHRLGLFSLAKIGLEKVPNVRTHLWAITV